MLEILCVIIGFDIQQTGLQPSEETGVALGDNQRSAQSLRSHPWVFGTGLEMLAKRLPGGAPKIPRNDGSPFQTIDHLGQSRWVVRGLQNSQQYMLDCLAGETVQQPGECIDPLRIGGQTPDRPHEFAFADRLWIGNYPAVHCQELKSFHRRAR